jgi:hypothetical protein
MASSHGSLEATVVAKTPRKNPKRMV